MEIINIIINACITVFSLGLFFVSLLSYIHSKNKKLLFVSGAFFLFFIKGLVLSISLFIDTIVVLQPTLYLEFFDLIIILILFMTTLKR
ncbi:MAG: hypothetical protein V1726_02780 [Methanobacteriota archaeon]